MSYLRISGYLGLIFLGIFWLTTGYKKIHDEQYFFGTIIIFCAHFVTGEEVVLRKNIGLKAWEQYLKK